MARPFRRLSVALWPLLALVFACDEITALPPGSQPFVPPPEYRLWWSMTEACSGLHGSFSSIDWYVVPGTTALPGTHGEYQGEWFVQGNRISLASAKEFDGSLVRHEMLHALLGVNGHPRSQFLDRCAGTVVCVEECMQDAGPFSGPPAGTPIVPASALQIGVELEPTHASAETDDGYFALVVSAHNPADHAVVAQLPRYGNDNLGVSFSYRMGTDDKDSVGTFVLAYDPQAVFFRPGETKHQVFDMRIGEEYEGNIEPGNYIAVGGFANHNSAALPITVSP
ncbi:MAG TPA: hypothetical protein VGO46_00640 [Gemmatimonadaceae bacterium]|jgi:hypothetical protein|nr:hypothetical protein [Gemmatimonadaceae bacterium]